MLNYRETTPKTLFDKIWDNHVVKLVDDSTSVLFIDRHYIHEVTSPQAFNGLRKRGITPLYPARVIATADHNVPTRERHLPITDPLSAMQLNALKSNCEEFGIDLYDLNHPHQGIVHVIGPELGFTLPGTTIVCGDSHTSTHGAFGAIAFGIGTSEVEMVLATQCIIQTRPKNMRIRVSSRLGEGVTSKDLALYIISLLTTNGGTGYFIEFCGTAIEAMSMEARMSLCNMSIELGARGALIAPDEVTIQYIRSTPNAPKGDKWLHACDYWKTLYTDTDALFDKEHEFDASAVEPMITYGTNPGMAMPVNGRIPSSEMISANDRQKLYLNALNYMNSMTMPVNGGSPSFETDTGSNRESSVLKALCYMNSMTMPVSGEMSPPETDVNSDRQTSYLKALNYMGYEAGEHIENSPIDYVFIGSCTNGRIEDLRQAAAILKGKRVAKGVTVWIVPGSKLVERQAREEGLAEVFIKAGAEFREPGCSACLAMNDDKIPEGKYCVATSNRNFEGRQGPNARTLLASPLTAAACALTGRVTDVRKLISSQKVKKTIVSG